LRRNRPDPDSPIRIDFPKLFLCILCFQGLL